MAQGEGLGRSAMNPILDAFVWSVERQFTLC